MRILNQSSSISQGWLRKFGKERNDLIVSTFRSVRDVDENSSRSYVQNYFVTVNEAKSSWKNTPTLPLSAAPKCVLYDISRSGRVSVSFYNAGVGTAGVKKDQGSFIEVIDQEDGLFRLDTSNVHGKIVSDTWFGGCSWSANETFVAYVAQLTTPTKTVVEQLAQAETDPFNSKNKFDYQEDWGEKYVDVSELGIFVLDIAKQKVTRLPLNDVKEFTIGQPNLISVGGSKYFLSYTAWNNKPRRLGMIYCYQRAASIWIADISNVLTTESTVTVPNTPIPVNYWKVSENIEIARSSRSSGDNEKLIFLGHEKGFLSHNGISELFLVSLKPFFNMISSISNTNAEEIQKVDPSTLIWKKIVPEVRNYTNAKTDFPGLFVDQLPKYPFHKGNNEIVLTTLWESKDTLVSIDLTGSSGVKEIAWWENELDKNHQFHDYSFQLLDTFLNNDEGKENYVLGAVSSPVEAPELVIVQLLNDGSSIVHWNPAKNATKTFGISSKANFFPLLKSLEENPLQWKVFNHVNQGIHFNSILLYPSSSSSSSLPLIAVPHGGPHSCFSNSFVASYVFLAKTLNAAVLLINYRGSTGFGQDSIESLLGKIGANDVEDLWIAINHALSLPSLLDGSKVGIIGGSHGGFLSSHMCGQRPSYFKFCCLRNPVTNIPAMASVTDIPDWCQVESGSLISNQGKEFPTFYQGGLNESQLTAMFQASPVRYIGQYNTPTLLCLGAKDRRVPFSQGIEFYHLLQMRNVPSK